MSQADPPYKSVAALNCVILGCANIWDVDRAYQTFSAMESTFGLTPNIHSYNALLCAFGKLNKVNIGALIAKFHSSLLNCCLFKDYKRVLWVAFGYVLLLRGQAGKKQFSTFIQKIVFLLK